MALSLELLNVLVLGVALTILLKDRLEYSHTAAPISSTTTTTTARSLVERSLTEPPDLSDFVGEWYDCMHTVLTSFEGDTQQKNILDTTGCDYTNIGNITRIRDWDSQALQFDVYVLNRCSFHGLGAQGQRPCPNDTLGDHTTPGKILVKYSFRGVGSFAESDRIQFFADQAYTRVTPNGTTTATTVWKPDLERAKVENVDAMVCKKHMDGMVCDWHLNEYRTAAIAQDSGCKKDDECKPGLGKQKCKTSGGTWTEECPRTKYVPEGFSYDSFASYYLVKDISQCNVDCVALAESKKNRTQNEDETGVR